MESQTIRVMIVDDHAMVRAGIKILLEQFEGIQVIGEAADGCKAMERMAELNPDVILMDLAMPIMDGIEATRRILAIQPDQHIIVLSGYLENERFMQAIKAGAQGCLEKTISPEDLVQSIRNVVAGKPSLDAGLAWKILHEIEMGEAPRRSPANLSDRELEILRLLTHGKRDHEIAKELVLTEVTIRTHISRILSKLGLENRVQAALYGLRLGLVPMSEIYHLVDTRWEPDTDSPLSVG